MQFCVRNGKIYGASRHLKDAMKIFTGVGQRNREEIGIFLFEEGEKLELLARIFTLDVPPKFNGVKVIQ